ncbi:MAG TPA: alpha/beta hydrolase, partial [Proteiniclasticum sp.]|nr:alpha/beta hydrolase [Proteiniclasticum sp.]
MIKTVIFIMLLVVIVASLLFMLVQTGKIWYKKRKSEEYENISRKRIKVFRLFLIVTLMSVGTVFISQVSADTPKIEIESDNSISEMIEVVVNGRKEWISIRGNDLDNPIILFLAGGPGGTQLGAVRRNLVNLEKDYIVVNWEQP